LQRLAHLDGLRGLAALIVTLSHLESMVNSAATGRYDNQTWLATVFSHVANGAYGVMIFFVLSGYVLLTGYGRSGNAAFAFGAVKRYFRLMPPILAALLLAWALSLTIGFHHVDVAAMIGGHAWLASVSPDRLQLGEALYQGLFGAFIGQHDYLGVLWTMKVEFFGSLMLFAVAAACYRFTWYWMATSAAIVLLVGLGGDIGIYLSLFFLGSIFFKHQLSLPVWAIPLGLMLGFAKPWDIASLALSALLQWPNEGPTSAAFLLNAIGAAIILLAVARPSRVTLILASPPLEWLGRISFSLYLCHVPVMQSLGLATFLLANQSVGGGPAAALALVVSMAMSLFVAEVMTRLADIPAQRSANRIAAAILGGVQRKAPSSA